MASGVTINAPEKWDLKNAKDASKTWKSFRQAWEIYEIASGTVEKPPLERLTTFLHIAEPDGREKYNGLIFHSEDERRNIDIVLESLKMTANL